jgi:hypothetical protein
MTEKTTPPKKPGRPVKNTIQPIKDTPDSVAQSIMNSAPKKDWDYLKK